MPLYWCLTLAIVALTLIRPGLLRHTVITGEYVTKSLLFVPYFRAGTREIFPILGPGWSLNYEMFFYALFALTLFAPLRWRLPSILLTLAVLFTAGTMVPSLRGGAVGLAYTSGLLLLFGFGLTLGSFYRHGRLTLSWQLSVAAALLGLYVLVGSWSPAWMREYIAPLAIVLGVVSLDASGMTPTWPWLLVLGDASYSIYLVHPFAFDLVEKIWMKEFGGGGEGSAVAFMTLAIGGAVGMALLTYRLIERPALKVLTRPKRIPAQVEVSAAQA